MGNSDASAMRGAFQKVAVEYLQKQGVTEQGK